MTSGKYIRTKPSHRLGKTQIAWNKGIKRLEFSKENHPRWKGGKPKCKICGKVLTNYNAKYCRKHMFTIETIWNKNTIGLCKPNSGSFKNGNTPPNKIGEGISRLNKSIRSMPEYKKWRNHIFGRDSYTCKHCNIRGVYFEAHHNKELWRIIKEYNMKTIIDARNCNELWDLNNGITLCKECHGKIDMSRGD